VRPAAHELAEQHGAPDVPHTAASPEPPVNPPTLTQLKRTHPAITERPTNSCVRFIDVPSPRKFRPERSTAAMNRTFHLRYFALLALIF
jgi:hypothetical protein